MKFTLEYDMLPIRLPTGDVRVFEGDPESIIAERACRLRTHVETYVWTRIPESSTGLTDMKAALNSSVKPDITHVRTPLLNYTARQGEYGDAKYERANYIRPTASLPEDFKRLRGYLRAVLSHTVQMLDSMERYQAMDPTLSDTEAMKVACYAKDTDPGNDKVGPSNMPHIGGACASLNMALEQAVTAGLLPKDPGTPWKDK